MLKRRNALSRMRPWIATAAAYALALQVLLTGVAAGPLMAAGDASASSPFIICHRTDGRVIEFNSPTGQYQRGPPLSISVFG